MAEDSESGIKDSLDEQISVSRLVEHLFRHQAGQVVSTLTRFFGVANLDLVEDVVQQTLLKALQQWVFRGVPSNPAGWILQTAKNHALDVLRREATFRSKQSDIIDKLKHDLKSATHESDVFLKNELNDDQLRMMFTCCHPALSREARIALTLKTLCGFNIPEIARAFLSQESTIAQRLVRAKRKIRDERIPFEVPDSEELYSRLDSVLEVLYLLFNEGYSANTGEDLIRQDLCHEAIRLTSLLAEFQSGQFPKVDALLSLLLLQASRFPARVDSDGNPLLLREQDRSLWDKRMIHIGIRHLEQSAIGDELSEYHLQAGIAACHALAQDYLSTDWQRILSHYDQLVSMNHSPVIALNRAVALSMVEGPEPGLRALDKIKYLPPMKKYSLLPSTYAEFHMQMGNTEEARECYLQVFALVGTEPERRFLKRKIRECENPRNGQLKMSK